MLKKIISYCLFPMVFAISYLYVYIGLEKGIAEEIILISISFSTAVIITIAERISPYYEVWNKPHNDLKTDVLHLGVSMILLPRLLDTLFSVLLLWIILNVPAISEVPIWPNHWPLGIQLIAAMLLGGFAEYWAHRAMHTVPLLWRLHATHHSPERLYWLNAARFHPIDTLITYSLATIPLLIMGANTELFLLVTVWMAVHGMFQHCNIHLRLGPLNYVFSMAELHRWHHSLKLEEANTNYGNNIIFWDIIFGTMFWPPGREPSSDIGLSDMKSFPTGYVGQLLSPFRWDSISKKVNSRQ